jgi:hypothetical protein
LIPSNVFLDYFSDDPSATLHVLVLSRLHVLCDVKFGVALLHQQFDLAEHGAL